MLSRVASQITVVLVVAATATGCQSPWQTASPGHGGGGGWFSWLGRSERTGGEDPLARLVGGGEYRPGAVEADRGAEQSRKQLYADRAGEMDLSPGGAQRPSVTTFEEAVPAEDDVASRVARSLQARRGEPAPEAATAGSVAGSVPSAISYDRAVVPAGHQAEAAAVATGLPAASGVPAPPIAPSRTYVDTAPPDAQSNPFFDPFGATARQSVAPADYRPAAGAGSGVRTASNAATGSSSGSSALRLLSTPSEQEAPASDPAIAYPNGGSSGGSGSLLRLLGDNPLRKDAAAPSTGGDYVP